MSEWHEQFRAYARAFGNDEVAAIVLRKDDREWIEWPAQDVEGLTFTLTADAILSAVPADDLQHVVGWAHSHPSGIPPEPSGTDDGQVRALAVDMAGAVVAMIIFGGPDYADVTVTRALAVDGRAFVADTQRMPRERVRSRWDDEAEAFYAASCPPEVPRVTFAGWDDPDYLIADDLGDECPWCFRETAPAPGMLCEECDDMAATCARS